MKKLLTVLLLVTMLLSISLTGCGLFGNGDGNTPDGGNTSDGGNNSDDGSSDTLTEDELYAIVNNSKPTKVVTQADYTTSECTLSGFYVTTISGSSMKFEYEQEKWLTLEEAYELGLGYDDRIATIEGVIYYKDGVYSTDDGVFTPGTGTMFDIKLDIQPSLIKDAALKDDNTVIEAKIAPENIVKVFGVDVGAVSDAELTVTTNGVNLTRIEFVCDTENGELALTTSYTYNAQSNLFPEEQAAG